MPNLAAPLAGLRDRGLALAARVGWLPPLAVRTALGVTFVASGWGKLHAIDQTVAYFTALGIPGAAVQAPVVAAIELVAGALVLVGLATRLAALLLTGVMAVAIATAIAPAADGPVALLGSLEVVYLASLLYLAVHGAGRVSLDRALFARSGSSHPVEGTFA